MIVLGLVLDLMGSAPDQRRHILQSVADDSAFFLGPATQQDRIPLVLEARSRSEADLRLESLTRRPGVVRVDVVYVDFSTGEAQPAPRSE